MVSWHISVFLEGGEGISPLFVDRLGCSLRFYLLEFDKEVITDGYKSHSHVFREECDIAVVCGLIWTFFTVLSLGIL